MRSTGFFLASPSRQSMVMVVVVLLAAIKSTAAAQLSQNYYASTCPNVETLVRGAVTKKLQETFNAAPGTLRLFFHDCFVRVRLRRFGAACWSRRRAQRWPRRDAVAGRAGPHHPRQGGGGRRPAVQQQGLLRRHPRARYARRRIPGWRAELPGGAGAAGRKGRDARHREAQPPRRQLQPGPAQQALRRQRTHADRHDRALRGSHDRRDALRQVRAAAVHVQGQQRGVAGPADEPRLPAADAADVPAQLQPLRLRHARRRHAHQVRQRILPDAAADEGPARLRPGALRRPPVPGHRQLLRRQPDGILRRIRRRHDQARTHRDQDRRRRRDPPGLHQGQLVVTRLLLLEDQQVHLVDRGVHTVASSMSMLNKSQIMIRSRPILFLDCVAVIM